MKPLRVWEAALAYFVMVFLAGFLFGMVRVLAVEPELGARNAELVEAPFMLATILLSAWLVSGACTDCRSRTCWGVGAAATSMVLAADLVVGMRIRGMTPAEVFLNREPISGAVYYALILVFAVAPGLFAAVRRRRGKPRSDG